MINSVKTRYWPVVRATYEELLTEIERWLSDGRSHYVCFCDGNGLPRAWRGDLELRAAYAGADAICADGIATDLLARICGGRSARLIGPKVFPLALEYGVSRGWRHYFYGANEETLKVLKEKMEARYPGVKIVGTYAPEFAADPVLPPIEKGMVDFLWVALGCPKQEKWCARHKNEVGVSVLMPVGAAFDFLSGQVADTPEWVHKVGLCWLWRLLTGGRRVFVRNMKCVSTALCVLMGEFIRIKLLGQPVVKAEECV